MPSRRRKSFGPLTFTIDRPKGTVKSWPQPDGSLKTFTYPVDYGYLPRHTAEDDEGLDFFVGDDPDGHLESFQKLKDGRFDETKFLVGVTDAERETIYALYGSEIWHRRTYRTMEELQAHLTPFRGAADPRYTLLFGTHGEIEKTAGILDGLKRMFGGRQTVSMPLANVRPHAGMNVPRTQEWADHSAAIVPPAPSHMSNTGSFHETTLPVLPSPPPPSYPAPSPAFSGRVSHAPGAQPVTPVRRTTHADMLTGAPGMQETLKKDLRARAALGARPVKGGGFELTRAAAANTMGAHLLRNAPGERVTPDLLQTALSSPEYQSARAAYKHAKLAALAALGFKAGAAKFADIAKRLNAEVLLSAPGASRSLFESLR